MTRNEPSEIPEAFEILLEEIEGEIDFVNELGAQGFRQSDYTQATEALAYAKRIESLRDKVIAIKKDWDSISSTPMAKEIANEKPKRNTDGRLRKGTRTPESAFIKPILEALIQLGGEGKARDVLDRIEPRVKGMLKDVDLVPIGSKPDESRWRNTARWARNSMVNDGLLTSSSPHGTWEISEQGRQYLKS